MKALHTLLPSLLKPCLKKKGMILGSLYLDWPLIIGPELSKYCTPEKFIPSYGGESSHRGGGILTVRVQPGATLILQHSTPQLIEKMNKHFGFPVVQQLKFLQLPSKISPQKNPLSGNTKEPEKINASDRSSIEERHLLQSEVEALSHTDLKEAFLRLGSALKCF